MSYCSLEEAWGTKTICSRVKNLSGKQNIVDYKITNERPCIESNLTYNDLEIDNSYSLLNQDIDNSNNSNSNIINNLLDVNTNNTKFNSNSNSNSNSNTLNVDANDKSFLNYQSLEDIYMENNEEDNQQNNQQNNQRDNEQNNEQDNEQDIEGFTNNDSIENFTTTLDDIMKRLDAIEGKLSNNNNNQRNVHDIILYIIIGVFILFSLDSIFKIGRLTV